MRVDESVKESPADMDLVNDILFVTLHEDVIPAKDPDREKETDFSREAVRPE